MNAHLAIAPLLVPFVAGVALLALPRMPFALERAVSLLAVLAQAGIAVALLAAVAQGDILVYRLGDWPAPWGIVLVADRLAAAPQAAHFVRQRRQHQQHRASHEERVSGRVFEETVHGRGRGKGSRIIAASPTR